MVPTPWAPIGRGEILSSHRRMELWVSVTLKIIINFFVHLHFLLSSSILQFSSHSINSLQANGFDCQWINKGNEDYKTPSQIWKFCEIWLFHLKYSRGVKKTNIKAAPLLVQYHLTRWKCTSLHSKCTKVDMLGDISFMEWKQIKGDTGLNK